MKLYTRNEAADIIELFENILDAHNIVIHDDEREGDESEGCLYGTTYSDLLDDVEEALIQIVVKAQDSKTECIVHEFE